MMNGQRGFMAALSAMLSFRVVLALVVSTTVTSSVTGPLAYQAHKARNEQSDIAAPGVVESSTPDPTRPPVTDGPRSSTSTTSTPTATSTPRTPGPSTTSPVDETAAPTTTTVTGEGLFASNRADHTGALPLDGALVARTVWVFFDGENAESVRYWLDDPTGSGTQTAEVGEPFDLAPNGFDFSTLSLGTHTLLAEVTTPTGTLRRLATFRVIDAG